MLILSRFIDETVVIKSGDTTITVMVVDVRRGKKGGWKVRLGFDAPPRFTVNRSEVQEAIDRTKEQAAARAGE